MMSAADFKKNEILQMLMLNPQLAINDEIDGNLSDDDLETIGAILDGYIDDKKSMIIIKNIQKLLDMVAPTRVHILVDGEIKESGGTELYKRIIEDGYSQLP
jgi:Fe-S cluster assembly ATP-binding protein